MSDLDTPNHWDGDVPYRSGNPYFVNMDDVPISQVEWVQLMSEDFKTRVIRHTVEVEFEVTTYWVGLRILDQSWITVSKLTRDDIVIPRAGATCRGDALTDHDNWVASLRARLT